MNVYVCKNGRIYGLEDAIEGSFNDPEFLPKCECGADCKHASNSIRISEELLEVSMS